MEQIDDAFLRNLRDAFAADLIKIVNANADLAERLRSAHVTAAYDLEEDFLDVRLDGASNAESVMLVEDLWLRLNPDDRKLVGVELEHLHRHVDKSSAALQFAFVIMRAGGVKELATRLPSLNEANTDPATAMRELAKVRSRRPTDV